MMLQGQKSEVYVFAIQLNLRLGAKHNLFLSQPSTLFLFHSFFQLQGAWPLDVGGDHGHADIQVDSKIFLTCKT